MSPGEERLVDAFKPQTQMEQSGFIMESTTGLELGETIWLCPLVYSVWVPLAPTQKKQKEKKQMVPCHLSTILFRTFI